MKAKSENVVASQEVALILEQVQQAIVEHKNMLKNAEMYLEQNGLKQEYERYMQIRQSKIENKEKSMDDCSLEKKKKVSVKEVKRSKVR